MSSTEDTPQLKAGHPPAVKVGNMRVVQKRDPNASSAKEVPAEPKPAAGEEGEEELLEEENVVKEKPINISGAVSRGNADFPEQAVKAYHEKPETQHNAYSLRDNSRHQTQRQVHQPRKSNN